VQVGSDRIDVGIARTGCRPIFDATSRIRLIGNLARIGLINSPKRPLFITRPDDAIPGDGDAGDKSFF